MYNIIPVILSGGYGTRLWPYSRTNHPKQYLSVMGGEKTMLQHTLLRINKKNNVLDPIIICNVENRFIVDQQLKDIGCNNKTIILEPSGRGSASAICAVGHYLIKNNLKETCMLVLSVDHWIENVDGFYKSIDIALKQINNKMVIFGVKPNVADTGYGYIKIGTKKNTSTYEVLDFVEKPNYENAKKYLESGDYFYNSGMFLFKPEILVDQFKKHAHKIFKQTKESIDKAKLKFNFINLDKESFLQSDNDSIDYAIMEKSSDKIAVLLDCKWSDIGNWESIYDVSKKNQDNNFIDGDIHTYKTQNSYIKSYDNMIVAMGLNNIFIIQTPDAIVVSSKSEIKNIKTVVNDLKTKNYYQIHEHKKVYRPWGWYKIVDEGQFFKVKRIYINPKSKLSLQKHNHRCEHWVVVQGSAYVINGKQTLTLKKGESTYIVAGSKHSLENKTNSVLEIIEVQSGSYLGEDDIIRFQDIYGRVEK